MAAMSSLLNTDGLPTIPPDPTANIPVWLKAILVLGPATVIALYLTHQMASRFDQQQAAMITLLNAHVFQMSQDQNANKTRDQNMLFVFKQVCLNTARTDAQRDGCRLVP